MGIRDERAKFSAGIVERIESALAKEFGDIYRTSDNYNTLTFEVGQFKDQDLYGSVKFTLHKPSYNLDDEIEIFEDFYAMREKQTAEKNKMKEAVKKQFYCFFLLILRERIFSEKLERIEGFYRNFAGFV